MLFVNHIEISGRRFLNMQITLYVLRSNQEDAEEDIVCNNRYMQIDVNLFGIIVVSFVKSKTDIKKFAWNKF